MRDIPVFAAEYGVSSLTLRQIPYTGEAYVRVQSAAAETLGEHLAECRDFCRAAGAERVYASGHEGLEGYPLHTAVYELRGTAWVDPAKLKNLFPVTEATVERWREYYNRRMEGVDNAAYLERQDEKRIAESGGAYFVHDNGKLLGIGWLEDCRLLAIAAEPGQGEKVMHTLMSLVEGAQMAMEAASTNTRALRLYERLGFLKTAELSRWYRL